MTRPLCVPSVGTSGGAQPLQIACPKLGNQPAPYIVAWIVLFSVRLLDMQDSFFAHGIKAAIGND